MVEEVGYAALDSADDNSGDDCSSSERRYPENVFILTTNRLDHPVSTLVVEQGLSVSDPYCLLPMFVPESHYLFPYWLEKPRKYVLCE